MDYCANHEDHVAVENCEQCGRPLCALCLWYGFDGRRLCEAHAKELQGSGEDVYPPSDYADAIQNSLIVRSELHEASDEPAVYKGNSQDVSAFVAAVLAVTALFSCCGGLYCLPIIALALGAIAYLNADKAVDPSRARRLSGIGLGAGTLMVLAIFACIGLYVALLFAAVVSSPAP